MVNVTDSQFNIAMKLAVERLIDDDIRESEQYAHGGTEAVTDERMKAKLWRSIKRRSSAPRTPVWRLSLRRAATVVLATGTLLFALAMSFEPVRAAFIDAIVTWYDNYIGVYFEREKDIPETIETAMKPTHIPDGWTMECVSSNSMMVSYIMFGNNGEMVIFEQIPKDEINVMVDDQEDVLEYVSLNNTTATLFRSSTNTLNLVWADRYVFSLNGQNVDVETLVRIANSVQ